MIIAGRRNVRSLIEHRNESTPEATFLIWENHQINYRTLNEKVNSLANGLLDLGISKGDRVIIHLPNRPEFIFSFFALLKIGAVAVLSNINNLLEEMCYTVSHSESLFVITENEYYDLIKKVQVRVPSLKQIILVDAEESAPGTIAMGSIFFHYPTELKGINVSPDDDASIMYTSGTTSKPKGVLLTQGHYVFMGEVYSKQVRLTPNDRHLCVIPLFHSNAMNHQLLPAVTTGAGMVLFRKFSSSSFGDQIREYGVTIVTIPAALLRFILNTPEKQEDGQNSLRAVFAAGNILTDEEFERFTRRFNVPIINWWGETEAVVSPLCSSLDGRRKKRSIGLPTLGYDVRIFDENDEEVPAGHIGEIVVRGLGKYSIMKEYYKDPEATRKTLKNGWLHTEDLGYMDEEGYFYFAGRKKEMIKVGGENVAAGEVEMVLNQHPKVAESAVIGVLDELGNEAIKAFVVLRDGQQASEQELKEYCSQKMAKFRVPKFFEFRTELPRTAVGKIERKALEKNEKNKK